MPYTFNPFTNNFDYYTNGAARSLLRSSQKVSVFDNLRMSRTPSDGTNSTGVSSLSKMRCQNNANNTQFLFAGSGLSDTNKQKLLQLNEQPWPYNYQLAAALEETVYSGTTGTGSSTSKIVDSAQLITSTWSTNQWESQWVAVSPAASSNVTLAAGVQTIPLTATWPVALKQDTLLQFGARWVRLRATASVGDTSLQIYPLNATINATTDTCARAYYGGETLYMVIIPDGSSASNRYVPITSSDGTSISLGSGLTSFSVGQPYNIRAIHPLTFNGQTSIGMNDTDVWTDPLKFQTVYGNAYKLRTFVSGGPWPCMNGYLSTEDGNGIGDCLFSASTNNLGAGSGPCLPVLAVGDLIGPPIKTYGVFSDSKAYGVGDLQSCFPGSWGFQTPTATLGYIARAYYGTAAVMNMGTPGEAGYPGAIIRSKRRMREGAMQYCDRVFFGFGANDLLDVTNGPLTLVQMQNMALGWYTAAIAAGVTDIVWITIGPLVSGALSSFFPGNSASQSVISSAVLAGFDNWLVSTMALLPHCRVFDLRPVAQLSGSPGVWNTAQTAVYSGTVTGTSTGLIIVDNALPSTVNTILATGLGPQVGYALYGVVLSRAGTPAYSYIATNLVNTAGQITLNVNLGVTPQVGDTYSIVPIPSVDGAHPTPFLHATEGALLASQFPVT